MTTARTFYVAGAAGLSLAALLALALSGTGIDPANARTAVSGGGADGGPAAIVVVLPDGGEPCGKSPRIGRPCDGLDDDGYPCGVFACPAAQPGYDAGTPVPDANYIPPTHWPVICRETDVPRTERCDGRDNDCDGYTDEGLGCPTDGGP